MKNLGISVAVVAVAATTLGICTLSTQAKVRAEGDVAINGTNFPDENFREFVKQYDNYPKDGVLSQVELDEVLEMDCSGCQIESLEGISNFSLLKELDCSDNRLTELNLKGIFDIEILDCSNNELESLSWPCKLRENTSGFGNALIKSLDCSHNNLTSLSLDGSSYLEQVDCSYNQITRIYSSRLYSVKTIDVSHNPAKLVSELSKFPKLETLNCSSMNLTALDPATIRITDLKSLDCSNNLLSSLDTTAMKNLATLDCHSNVLTTFAAAKTLVSLDCSDNCLGSVGLSSCTALKKVNCSRNYLTAKPAVPSGCTLTYDPQKKVQSGYLVIDRTAFPDEIFYEFVKTNYDTNPKDGYLSDAEIQAVTTVDCKELGLTDLTGIGYFTSMNYLNCSQNNLKTLDLSKNEKLSYLYCFDNQLTDITFSIKSNIRQLYCQNNKLKTLNTTTWPALYELYCQNNRLTGLDVSANTNLDKLYFAGNEVSSIDVSNCTGLKQLNFADNLIATLDVSKNTKLAYLNCSMNRLKKLDVSKNVMLNQLFCHTNSLTTLDLSACTRLVEVDCKMNFLTSKPTVPSGCVLYYDPQLQLSGNFVRIDKTNFPDSAFRDFVRSTLDTTPDGILFQDELNAVEKIKCRNCGIENLEGIELFPNLNDLNCSGNPIKDLDLSGVPNLKVLDCCDVPMTSLVLKDSLKLETLYCIGMDLESLDLRLNSNLKELYCRDNKLTSLNLTYNTKLETLDCRGNLLTTMDLSANKALVSIDCRENPMTALVARNLPVLTTLYCSDIQLESLDVSQDPALESLGCQNNALTTLNVAGCRSLVSMNCSSNQLTVLDLSDSTKLERLDCQDNNLNSLKIQNSTELVELNCSNNKLVTLSMTPFTKMRTLDCRNNKLGAVYTEYMTDLQSLNCSNNALSWLNCDNCPNLLSLNCSFNSIESIKISNCPSLRYTDCTYNFIEAVPQAHGNVIYNPQKTILNIQGVGASGLTTSSVKVFWLKNDEADGYDVYYRLSTETTMKIYKTVNSKETTQVEVTGLQGHSKEYHFAVRAYKNVSGIKVYGALSTVVSERALPTPTRAPSVSPSVSPSPTRKTSPTPTKKSTPTPVVKPGKPTNVKAVSASVTSVNVSWSAVSGATGYQVWRSTQKDSGFVALGSVTATSRVSTGLTTGTTYYYKVRAYKETNGTKLYGDYSAVVSCVPKPAVPGNVKATVVSLTKVRVAWSAVTGATGYEVYRSTSPDGTFSKLGAVTTTSRDCPGLTTGTTYYFKVRAYKEVNGTKVYSNYSAVVSCVPKPTAPTNVKAVVASATKVTVSWNAVTGATGYEVYRATSANGPYSKLGTVTTTSRDCPGLTTGTTYYFKVRAYVEINGTKYYSNYSTVVNATPKK